MQSKLCLILLLSLLGAMAYLPSGRAQRSPYAPMPVSLPGLLPRFGGQDNSDLPPAGSGGPSSSSGGAPTPDEDVGGRINEVGRGRPTPSRGQGRCPSQQVPCYDCVVHISSNGQITKFSAEQGGRRW